MMRLERFFLVLLLVLPGVHMARADETHAAQRCTALEIPAERLSCYDRFFRPAPPAPDAAASPVGNADSPLSRFWELSPAHKRGTFVVKTHLPNFFLPFSYTSHINRSPESPTHPATGPQAEHSAMEAKLQLSLRTKILENLVLPNADLWFTYTQRSQWQLWNSQESSPFRNTDHQPEVLYVVPIPESLRPLPAGWQWRMIQAGWGHQSNGQGGELSRSWNYASLGTAIERGEFGLMLRHHQRMAEEGMDDNPDLLRHLGNSELIASWLPGKATATLAWRFHVQPARHNALQFDWTYPVDRDNPSGLRWYFQAFAGYGESLLDYNHYQERLGMGFSLFQY